MSTIGLTPTPKPNFVSHRQAIQKLSTKLGPKADVIHNSITVTEGMTVYDGRDVLRYAVMMAVISRRDH